MTEATRDMAEKLPDMKKSAARNWYEIKNAASDTAEVFIYDQIGEDFWTGEGVTAKGFIDEIGKITAPNIHLRINSPGGSVFDGQAIYTALVRHPAKVTTYIDGLAASIASVIALAGEKVVMASNALFMIHNPMSSAQGYASDMRKMADVLDKIRESIVTVYNQHTNQPHEEIIAAMDAETWYTAQEAKDAGFVDELVGAAPVTAHFDLSSFGFRHAPTNELTVEPVAQAEETPAEEPAVVEPQDPESVGATDSEQSDGASDTPTQSEVYVNGVGFLTF